MILSKEALNPELTDLPKPRTRSAAVLIHGTCLLDRGVPEAGAEAMLDELAMHAFSAVFAGVVVDPNLGTCGCGEHWAPTGPAGSSTRG